MEPLETTIQEKPKQSFLKSKLFVLTVILVTIFTIAYAGVYIQLNKQVDRATHTGFDSQNQICIQVITAARNPTSGECRDFKTPCDVPKGWTKVKSCGT